MIIIFTLLKLFIMKRIKIYSATVLAIIVVTVILASCGPNDQPPPPQTLHRHAGPWNQLGEEGWNLAETEHPCPTPGENCIVILPNVVPSATRSTLIEELGVFTNALNTNNLSSYFSSVSNYATLFPNLTNYNNSDVLEALINGTYQVSMLNNRTIIIYQNQTLTCKLPYYSAN